MTKKQNIETIKAMTVLELKELRTARESSLAKRAERKAKEEAERKAKEEAERKAKEEAERKAKEEAERKAKEEAELSPAERMRAHKKARKAKAKEEAERKAKEESERKAKEEADLLAFQEAVQKTLERATARARAVEARAIEAQRKAKEEAERKAKEEAERKAKEEAERKAKEEAERKAKEEAERKAAEKAARLTAAKAAAEEACEAYIAQESGDWADYRKAAKEFIGRIAERYGRLPNKIQAFGEGLAVVLLGGWRTEDLNLQFFELVPELMKLNGLKGADELAFAVALLPMRTSKSTVLRAAELWASNLPENKNEQREDLALVEYGVITRDSVAWKLAHREGLNLAYDRDLNTSETEVMRHWALQPEVLKLGREATEYALFLQLGRIDIAPTLKAYKEHWKGSYSTLGATLPAAGGWRFLNLQNEEELVLAHSLGYITNCCQHLQGPGESAMAYGLLEGAFAVYENNGKVKAQAECWIDTESGAFVFDNVETECPTEEMSQGLLELGRALNGEGYPYCLIGHGDLYPTSAEKMPAGNVLPTAHPKWKCYSDAKDPNIWSPNTVWKERLALAQRFPRRPYLEITLHYRAPEGNSWDLGFLEARAREYARVEKLNRFYGAGVYDFQQERPLCSIDSPVIEQRLNLFDLQGTKEELYVKHYLELHRTDELERARQERYMGWGINPKTHICWSVWDKPIKYMDQLERFLRLLPLAQETLALPFVRVCLDEMVKGQLAIEADLEKAHPKAQHKAERMDRKGVLREFILIRRVLTPEEREEARQLCDHLLPPEGGWVCGYHSQLEAMRQVLARRTV